MFNNYFDEIFRTSEKYLKEVFTEAENKKLTKSLEGKKFKTTQEYVDFFEETYTDLIKKKHQSEYKEADKDFNKFIINKTPYVYYIILYKNKSIFIFYEKK